MCQLSSLGFFIENVQIFIIYQNNSNHSKETKDRRNSYAWTKDTAKLQLISITILGHQNSLVNSKLNKPITLGPVQNDQKRREGNMAAKIFRSAYQLGLRFKEAVQRFTWWKCSVWCFPVSNEYRAFELSSLRQFTNEPFGTCLVCIFIDWWIACDKIRPNNSLQQDRCPYVSFQGMLFVSKYDQTYNSTYRLNLSATHLMTLRLGKFLPWNPGKFL